MANTGPSTTKNGSRGKVKGSNTVRNATSRGKGEANKYLTQPIQYILPNAKNSSALGYLPNSNMHSSIGD